MEDFFKEKDFYELLSEASNNNSIITVDHIDISDKEFEKVVAMYDYAWSLAYGKDLFDGEEYIGTTNDPEATQKAYQIICDIYDRIKELEPSIKQSSNINWSGTKETSLLRIFDYYHKVVEPVRYLIKESKPHAKVKAIEEDKPNKPKGKVLQFKEYLTGCDKDRIKDIILQDNNIMRCKDMASLLLALHNLGYIDLYSKAHDPLIKSFSKLIGKQFSRQGVVKHIRKYLDETNSKTKEAYNRDWGINMYITRLKL
mgnify:CR=1 FL=1